MTISDNLGGREARVPGAAASVDSDLVYSVTSEYLTDGDETGRHWKVVYVVRRDFDDEGEPSGFSVSEEDGRGNGPVICNCWKEREARRIADLCAKG